MLALFRLSCPALLLSLALTAACGQDTVVQDADGDLPDAATADTGAADIGTDDTALADTSLVPEFTPDAVSPPAVPLDWRPTAEDFGCLTDWTPVRGFFLTNLLGQLDEAVAVAEGGFADPVPPGTVIQLVPLEAMVKLAPGANPETADWEFLLLDTGRGETTITARGGAEVTNGAGSCFGCHAGAADRDMVCEQTGLCNAAELSRVLIDALVAGDRRCR